MASRPADGPARQRAVSPARGRAAAALTERVRRGSPGPRAGGEAAIVHTGRVDGPRHAPTMDLSSKRYNMGLNDSLLDMQLLTIGINHHTAPVALRERVAFPLEQIKPA